MHRRWIGRWWMRSALIVVVCVMATTAVAQDNNDDALRSYYSGNGFLNRELYDLAAREYEAFLDAAPFHEKAVVARYGLAVSLVRLGRHADAVGHLEQLVGVNNFEYAAESLMMLGQSRLALGEYAKSANAFGTVLDRHSDSELADEAAALRSEAFYYNGDHALVDGPASILMDRFPDSPLRERTEFFRALAAMARAEFAPAADYFNAMLDRYPDGQYAGQATLLMGQCEHRADRLGNALSSYERVVERGNDTFVPDALYGMSIILHRDERFDDAEQALDRLLQSYPDNGNRANAQLLRGRVAFDQGEYANAMTFLEALSDGPMALRDDAAYWIGKCALREGRNGDAMQRLEDALQAYPDSALRAEMLYDIAVAAHREANYRKTSDALERFGREFPEHELAAAGMHLLASTMHQQERYDESTALCDQFSSTYVDHPMLSDVQFIAAENAYLQANYADADQRFQTYLTNHPNGERIIDAEFRRGMALYHLNDYARSRDVLKAVEAAARENDRYRLAIFTLGDMAFQEEDWNAARKDFEQYLTFGTDQVAADDAMLKLGLAQLRSDELDDALATFETMLATFDDSTHRAQAMFERGQALVLLDRDEDAEAGFEALLREHPQTSFTAHALNHLGTIAQSAGRFDDAAQYFERVAAADPSLSIVPETMFQRGQALLASRRHADAEEAFSVLLTSYPDSARAASAAALRAIATARQDEHERALTMIADVERDGLNDLDDTLRASMLYEKAWCQRNREDDTAAEMTYQDVIAISNGGPLRLHSMLELAELQAEDERYGTAQQQLETLLTSLDGNDDAPADLRRQAMYRLGVCEFRLEAFEDASKRFEAYLARYPDSDVEASARLLCGESHYKQGRHEQAIEHLTVVTTSHAKSDAYGPALLRLGESQAVLQYWSQSEESYRAFMAHAPESPQWFQAQFGIGWALDNRGEHDAAIEAYQPVVYNHRGPTAARAQFQIGECLFALERYDEAVRELVKVDILYGYPEWSAAALYEAGRCFQAMNDPVRARQQYEQVRTDHEGTDWARLASERLEELSRTTLPGR